MGMPLLVCLDVRKKAGSLAVDHTYTSNVNVGHRLGYTECLLFNLVDTEVGIRGSIGSNRLKVIVDSSQ